MKRVAVALAGLVLAGPARALVPGRLFALDVVPGVVGDSSPGLWEEEVVIEKAQGSVVRRFPRPGIGSVRAASIDRGDPDREAIVRALGTPKGFSLSSPTESRTRTPVLVDPPLPPGTYRFRVVAKRRGPDGTEVRVASPPQEIVVE